jgi:hypothetical protein
MLYRKRVEGRATLVHRMYTRKRLRGLEKRNVGGIIMLFISTSMCTPEVH